MKINRYFFFAFATSVSYGLQYGVPLRKFVRTFTNTSFTPAGITDDPEIRTASSIIDYIFRRMGKTYLTFDERLEVGLASMDEQPAGQTSLLADAPAQEAALEQAMEAVAEAEAAISEVVTTVAASTADLPVATEALRSDGVQGDKGVTYTKPGKAGLAASQLTSPGEQRTDAYKKYVEGAAQSATPQSAESVSGAAGFAGRQADAAQSLRPDDAAPLCYNCGNQTQKAGSCYVCTSCGSTTGCS